MTETPFIKPRLTLRVGVTGHRPKKLGDAANDLLRARAGAVLTCLRTKTQRLQDASNQQGELGFFQRAAGPDLRFVTAIAEGSDTLTAGAAVDQGYALNLVLPFPRDLYELDFEGKARD